MNWWKLRRTVNSSWLIATLGSGIVIGVIAAAELPLGWFSTPVWLVTGLSLLLAGLWRRRVYIVPLVLIAGCLVGLWRGSTEQMKLSPYAQLVGYHVTVKGIVSEDVALDKNDAMIVRLHVTNINNHSMSGNLWLTSSTDADVKRSDIVTAEGMLGAGFGSFSGSMYRADVTRVERTQPGDVALQIRDQFADNVRTAVPDPEASLGIGYLVGQRRNLPSELSSALQIAGLTHIVVASGYNLTILVRLARRLLAKISKYLATITSGGLIIAFIAVTGMSPSMSRAGLVTGLSLLAWYHGRKFHPLVLLSFAASVTLLVNPSYGWNDLGWQLSFAAFAGVMIVAPLGQRYFFGMQKPGTIRQIIGETVSAQIATLPILVMAFGQFSNVAIIANLLILPFVPLAMLLTFVAGIGALLLPAGASLIGSPASWLLQYMTHVAQYLAQLPWAQTTVAIGGCVVVGYYMVLIALCVLVARKTQFNLRDANIVE